MSNTMYLNGLQSTLEESTRFAIFIASSNFSVPNQSSPSRKISSGMLAMISCGSAKGLPFREKNFFSFGCQKALTPSYFSNIHLFCFRCQQLGDTSQSIVCKSLNSYHLVGSIFDSEKKQAVIGCPKSGMEGVTGSKYDGGMSPGMLCLVSTITSGSRSGRAALIVAAKLTKTEGYLTCRRELANITSFVHRSTNKVQ